MPNVRSRQRLSIPWGYNFPLMHRGQQQPRLEPQYGRRYSRAWPFGGLEESKIGWVPHGACCCCCPFGAFRVLSLFVCCEQFRSGYMDGEFHARRDSDFKYLWKDSSCVLGLGSKSFSWILYLDRVDLERGRYLSGSSSPARCIPGDWNQEPCEGDFLGAKICESRPQYHRGTGSQVF